MEEPDLTSGSLDQSRFGPDARGRVEELLASLSAPVRLSILIDALAKDDSPQEVLELVALTGLQAFAPEQEDGAPRLFARHLANAHLSAHGLFGDELELVPWETRSDGRDE